MDQDAIYLSKVDHFLRLYNDRADTAVSLLAGNPAAIQEIEYSREVIKAAVAELTRLYREIYIERSSSLGKDAVLGFTRLEANVAMATQQTLGSMRKLVSLTAKGGVGKQMRASVLRRRVRTINASLARREPAAPFSLSVAIPELLLAQRMPVKTALTLIGLVVLHRSLTDWFRRLDPGNFFRGGDIRFEAFEAATAEMAAHPRRVMLMIGNHDAALYEGAIAYRAALLLGSQRHLTMARRGVYPVPPPESAGDVVYVDEGDPKLNPVTQSLAAIKQYSQMHNVVSFAIYPEGMLAFTGSQMPLVPKDGAYIIARKLAVELGNEGIPVYLVELKTNVLKHLTEPASSDAVARIVSVELVPSDPMVKGQVDRWTVERRLKSQTIYNEDRGERMLDIVGAVRVPDSRTFQATGLPSRSGVR